MGTFGNPGVATTTAMYLTDTARNGISNLRVLTPDSTGFYGGAGSTNTPIVANIAAGYHQANQLVVKSNSDGSSSLAMNRRMSLIVWLIYVRGSAPYFDPFIEKSALGWCNAVNRRYKVIYLGIVGARLARRQFGGQR